LIKEKADHLPLPQMNPTASIQLFDYARRFVSPKDITDFCPSDPGYPDYVLQFNSILKTCRVPSASNFAINETVDLTIYADASSKEDPIRFRRFRIFTSSVGLGVSVLVGGGGSFEMEPNYIAISLMDDALVLEDVELLQQLGPAFAEYYLRIKGVETVNLEAMFLLLGQIILSFMGYRTKADIPYLAEQILKDFYTPGRGHLWECATGCGLHPVWKALVKRSFPVIPTDESVAVLREALLGAEEI